MSSAGSGMAGSQPSTPTSSSKNSSATDGGTQAINSKYPLWAHVTKVSADPTGAGGNKYVTCRYCGVSFHGSYSREEQAGKEFILNGATRKTLPLPPYDGPGGPSPSSRKRKSTGAGAGKQQGIAESFNLETKQQADALIARMFYTGGIPFNLARNPNASM